jgi:hypothetical protein
LWSVATRWAPGSPLQKSKGFFQLEQPIFSSLSRGALRDHLMQQCLLLVETLLCRLDLSLQRLIMRHGNLSRVVPFSSTTPTEVGSEDRSGLASEPLIVRGDASVFDELASQSGRHPSGRLIPRHVACLHELIEQGL